MSPRIRRVSLYKLTVMRSIAPLVALSLLLLSARTVASDIDDTVFLHAGGRLLGVVIADEPESVRVRLPDGSVRTLARSEVDHVTYGGETASVPAEPNRAEPVAAKGSRAPAWGVGTLRFESTEPGEIWIDGGSYGATPRVVENLAAGAHRVVVKFHQGSSEARVIGVQGGAETVVRFETPTSLRVYREREGLRFGVGLKAGASLDPDLSSVDPVGTFQLVGRLNYAASRTFEFRADLAVGSWFAAKRVISYRSECQPVVGTRGCRSIRNVPVGTDNEADWRNLGVGLGGAIQWNLAPVYVWSLGIDAAVGLRGTRFGAHFSPLSFRFGSKHEFLLSFQGEIGYYDTAPHSGVVVGGSAGLSRLFL